MLSKVFLLALIAAFSLFGQDGFSYGDSILAVVGDKVITAYEVMQASSREEARLPRELSVQKRLDEVVAVRRRVLNNMIDHELIYLEFQALKAKVPESVLQERLDQAVVTQAGGDRAKFEEMLYREQMTVQEFTERLSKNLAVDMLIYDRVNRGITISPLKIQRYYESHAADFLQPARYRVEVILLKKDGRYKDNITEILTEIQDKLRSGAVFSDLAKEFSEGANAEQGGDQGWLTDMNEKLKKLVLTLKTGEIAADALELGNSFYLVRLAEFSPEKDSLTNETEGKIREILLAEEENRRYDKFLRELRLKYPFKRMDEMP